MDHSMHDMKGMDHSHMKHSSSNESSNQMMMFTTFQWSTNMGEVLFSGVTVNQSNYPFLIVFTCLLCVVKEILYDYRLNLIKRIKQSTNQLVNQAVNQTSNQIMKQSNNQMMLSSFLYAINLTISYLIMLLIMSYNVGIFLTIIVSTMVSHYILQRQSINLSIIQSIHQSNNQSNNQLQPNVRLGESSSLLRSRSKQTNKTINQSNDSLVDLSEDDEEEALGKECCER